MRFHHVVVATLAVCALPSTHAFTQGELLLPSYLCGPAVANADGTITGTDGKPKALGGVLAGLQEYTYATSKEVDANNDFLYDPVTDPMIFLGAMHNAKAAHVSKQFHGGDRRPLPPGGLDNQTTTAVLGGTLVPGNIYTGNGDAKLGPIKDYNNVSIPIKAQTNVLQVVGIPAIPADTADTAGNMLPSPTNFTTIKPNQLVILSLGALNDVAGRTGAANVFDPANGGDNALDGAIVYAQNAKNVRIGKFASGGENAAAWSACGPDGNGIVHTQLLSDTNVYNGPQFFLNFDYAWPNNGNPGITPLTMMGAAVSDGGFGYHQTKWQVQPLPDLTLDINALNKADTAVCMNKGMVPRACAVSCLDCISKAGSVAANKAKGIQGVTVSNFAKVTCTPDMNIGNGKTTATIWSATCTIKNKVTPVAPVGTFIVAPKAAKDANGNDMPISMDDQANLDALAAALAPDTTTSTCPNSNQNNNQVNTATQASYYSWWTTITVAASAIFAARR